MKKEFAIAMHDGVDFGHVPQTPTDHSAVPALSSAYAALMNVAMKYGTIVGYAQEQNGTLIHHLFPIKKTETEQISTSSKVNLGLHTETAFHPYRPDYVVLGCLRGDPSAATTYADVEDVMMRLGPSTIQELKKRQFITSVDVSFRQNGEQDQEVIISVLEQTDHGMKMTFDETLIRGANANAEMALLAARDAINESVRSVYLRAGEILVINNDRVVHGRTPFTPRYDGTDRWLLRCLIREALPPESDRDGTVITTTDFSSR